MYIAIRRVWAKNPIKTVAESKDLLTYNIETIVNNMELKSQPLSSRYGSIGMRE